MDAQSGWSTPGLLAAIQGVVREVEVEVGVGETEETTTITKITKEEEEEGVIAPGGDLCLEKGVEKEGEYDSFFFFLCLKLFNVLIIIVL